VQHIVASAALHVYVIDYDTMGADEADLADIPHDGGTHVKAYVCVPPVGVNKERTEELIKAIVGKLNADSIAKVSEIGRQGTGE
jgi:hypothetical protein